MTYTITVPNTSTGPLFTCHDAMTLMDILGLRKEAVDRIHRGGKVTVHGNGRYFLGRYTTLEVEVGSQ